MRSNRKFLADLTKDSKASRTSAARIALGLLNTLDLGLRDLFFLGTANGATAKKAKPRRKRRA